MNAELVEIGVRHAVLLLKPILQPPLRGRGGKNTSYAWAHYGSRNS